MSNSTEQTVLNKLNTVSSLYEILDLKDTGTFSDDGVIKLNRPLNITNKLKEIRFRGFSSDVRADIQNIQKPELKCELTARVLDIPKDNESFIDCQSPKRTGGATLHINTRDIQQRQAFGKETSELLNIAKFTVPMQNTISNSIEQCYKVANEELINRLGIINETTNEELRKASGFTYGNKGVNGTYEQENPSDYDYNKNGSRSSFISLNPYYLQSYGQNEEKPTKSQPLNNMFFYRIELAGFTASHSFYSIYLVCIKAADSNSLPSFEYKEKVLVRNCVCYEINQITNDIVYATTDRFKLNLSLISPELSQNQTYDIYNDLKYYESKPDVFDFEIMQYYKTNISLYSNNIVSGKNAATPFLSLQILLNIDYICIYKNYLDYNDRAYYIVTFYDYNWHKVNEINGYDVGDSITYKLHNVLAYSQTSTDSIIAIGQTIKTIVKDPQYVNGEFTSSIDDIRINLNEQIKTQSELLPSKFYNIWNDYKLNFKNIYASPSSFANLIWINKKLCPNYSTREEATDANGFISVLISRYAIIVMNNKSINFEPYTRHTEIFNVIRSDFEKHKYTAYDVILSQNNIYYKGVYRIYHNNKYYVINDATINSQQMCSVLDNIFYHPEYVEAYEKTKIIKKLLGVELITENNFNCICYETHTPYDIYSVDKSNIYKMLSLLGLKDINKNEEKMYLLNAIKDLELNITGYISTSALIYAKRDSNNETYTDYVFGSNVGDLSAYEYYVTPHRLPYDEIEKDRSIQNGNRLTHPVDFASNAFRVIKNNDNEITNVILPVLLVTSTGDNTKPDQTKENLIIFGLRIDTQPHYFTIDSQNISYPNHRNDVYNYTKQLAGDGCSLSTMVVSLSDMLRIYNEDIFNNLRFFLIIESQDTALRFKCENYQSQNQLVFHLNETAMVDFKNMITPPALAYITCQIVDSTGEVLTPSLAKAIYSNISLSMDWVYFV